MATNVPDGGWGWVICFGCFVIHLLTDGIFFSFGIIYIEFLSYFGETKGGTAWIMSMPPGVGFLIGPLVACLCYEYGCRIVVITGSLVTFASLVVSTFVQSLRIMYISLGIMSGIGTGMVYLSSIITVCQYFDKKRAMATGIAVCGTGIGVFIFGPLSNMLIDMYTWKGALLIEAALILHCLPVGMLYIPLEQYSTCSRHEQIVNTQFYGAIVKDRNTNTPSECTFPSDKGSNNASEQVIRSLKATESRKHVVRETIKIFTRDYIEPLLVAPFVIVCTSMFLFNMFYLMPNFYLPDRALHAGIQKDKAAWLVSAVGISNTASRAGFGWLADKPCVNKTFLCASALTVCGFIMSICPILLVDIFGIEKFAQAFGVCNMFSGVAIVVGPPLAGWLYDKTGSYNGSFITAGTALFSAGIILHCVLCMKSNKHILLKNTSADNVHK